MGVTFVFTLLFIFGLGILILDGQRYIAEIKYYQGMTSWQAGNKDEGIKDLLSAASLNNSSDLYFRQLSQVYLFTLQYKLQNAKTAMTDAEKNQVQTSFANAINAAKIATNLNPKSAINWTNLGYIYQSLNGLAGDTSTWSINSYNQALKLDPNNPYLYSQEGAVNFISALALGQDKVDQKTQLLNTAKGELNKSISLNSNYLDALYTLGLVYDALGQKDQAIDEFTKVQQLNPQDTTVPKILSNLNAGLPALQTPPAATPPAENSTGNSTIKK